MRRIWEHGLSNELQADYQAHPILLAIPPAKDY